MNLEPKLMNLPRMRNILAPHSEELRRKIYIDDRLAIVHNSESFFHLILRQHPPFSFDDRRMGIILHGKIEVNINLVNKTLEAGTLIFFGPGTIVNPISISSDIEFCGFGIPADFPLPGSLPQAFNGQVRDFQLPVSEADLSTARNILDTIWHVVHQKDYNLQTVGSLILAQMHHYDSLYRQYADQQQNLQSRDQSIFDRFIQLINIYSQHEHHIAFYAEKLFLTERYLGTIIRQTSGVTAKEWIDRAILARIKVELRHTNKTIAHISDDMNFPNPSFFNKYFKRLTGTTPLHFRTSKD